MNSYKFSINVVVRHPSRRAEDIATALAWTPYNAWSFGESRITPAGTALSGNRIETMCAFRFESGNESASLAIAEKMAHLVSKRAFLQDLLSTGGALKLNVGLNGQFGGNLELAPETMRDMSDLRIVLSVECFPDG